MPNEKKNWFISINWLLLTVKCMFIILLLADLLFSVFVLFLLMGPNSVISRCPHFAQFSFFWKREREKEAILNKLISIVFFHFEGWEWAKSKTSRISFDINLKWYVIWFRLNVNCRPKSAFMCKRIPRRQTKARTNFFFLSAVPSINA